MLGCKMLQKLLPNHLTINMVVNSCFVCSNMYSLHAHSFIKNTILSFWHTNINFSYINIGQKMY